MPGRFIDEGYEYLHPLLLQKQHRASSNKLKRLPSLLDNCKIGQTKLRNFILLILLCKQNLELKDLAPRAQQRHTNGLPLNLYKWEKRLEMSVTDEWRIIWSWQTPKFSFYDEGPSCNNPSPPLLLMVKFVIKKTKIKLLRSFDAHTVWFGTYII